MSDHTVSPSASGAGTLSAEEHQSAERETIAARREATDGGAGDALVPEDVLARAGVALRRGEQVADVGVAVPPFATLGTIRRAIAYASGRFLLYLLRLITVDQRQFNRLLHSAVADLHQTALQADAAIDAIRTDVQQAGARADALDTRLQVVEALDARLQAVEGAVGPFGWHIHEITSILDDRDGRVAALQQLVDDEHRALAEVRDTAAYLRRRITERDVRIDALLAQIGAAPPAPVAAPTPEAPPFTPAAVGDADASGTIDEVGFQETFRGDETALKEWQRRYVAKFARCTDVLDVGCGRGEFLELMREAGVSARGVDLNTASVLRCREKGLEVAQADALAYLAELPDGALGGIFCAQVIEHLPAAAAVRLIQLAHAKLHPGGVLLIETLNPECLLVHYRWFWMDLTHVRLMHPETLKFLFLSAGFHALEGQFPLAREQPPLLPPLTLAAEPPAQRDAFNAATQHLNVLLHASPDYALIGYR